MIYVYDVLGPAQVLLILSTSAMLCLGPVVWVLGVCLERVSANKATQGASTDGGGSGRRVYQTGGERYFKQRVIVEPL